MHGATYPLRPDPAMRGVQVATNTAQLPSITAAKRVQSASMHSGRPRSSRASSSSLTGQRVLPVESVMAMNKEAMAMLQEGDITLSYEKLTEALLAADKGARQCSGGAGTSRLSVKERHDQLEAWLIAFAATLSNLGCVRRRANELQDALLYLEDARKVELKVFGKPSCSTMVNLSAVLLGLGRGNEALGIAHECSTASASCDPMLHVIALHNYGVTLSAQATAEARQQAVPVLMQALREAESRFGEAHPTTILIRERCGMLTSQPQPTSGSAVLPLAASSRKNSSSQKDASKSLSVSKQGRHESQMQSHQQQQQQPPQQQQQPLQQQQLQQWQQQQLQQWQQQQKEVKRLVPAGPLPPLISTAQRRAKEALQALDYGSPLAPMRAKPHARSLDSADMKSDSLPPKSLTPIAGEAVQQAEWERDGTQEPITRRSTSSVRSACLSSITSIPLSTRSSRNTHPAPLSAELESVEWNSAEELRHTQPSECVVPLQTPLEMAREVSKGGSLGISSHSKPDASEIHTATTVAKPPKPPRGPVGSFVDLRGHRPSQEPSFFRFAPPVSKEPSPASESSPPPPVVRPTTGSLSGSVPGIASPDNDTEESEKPSPAVRVHAAFVRTIGVSPAERREQRLREESAEEVALRAERRARAKAEAEQAYFEETLAAIIARTHDRAARAIQYTWLYWWNNIGRRRRELRARREAERAARETRRLALLEYEGRRAEAQRLKREASEASKAASAALMQCAVRCGKKWLARTAAVRAAARGLLRGPARGEAEWNKCIARVQAVWRGRVARAAVKSVAAEARQAREARAAVEQKALAALVLVQAWRSAAARTALRTRREECLGPIATRLQRWIRETMAERRARGVDCVSRLRRHIAARRIQRQWRERTALLAQCMADLRVQLNESRGAEATAARLLQRCGRGLLERRGAAARGALARRLRRAQDHVGGFAMTQEEGQLILSQKRRKDVPSNVYIPTPAAEVEAIAERERELCHIDLFVEPVAQRTRKEWSDALRLRPFDVRLRRAHEDLLCTLEHRTARRERAARRIQREFRNWLRIRDEAFRDNTLLLINRGWYQEDEFGKKVEQIRFRREVDGGRKVFGDQTAPMRAEVAVARAELTEVEPLVRTHVPWEEIRCQHERYDTEMALRRDEELLEKNKREEGIARVREELMRCAAERLAQSPIPKIDV